MFFIQVALKCCLMLQCVFHLFIYRGVGFSFLFSWIFMIVVLILFLVGGNTYTLICVPWKNQELFQVNYCTQYYPFIFRMQIYLFILYTLKVHRCINNNDMTATLTVLACVCDLIKDHRHSRWNSGIPAVSKPRTKD